MTPAAIAMLVQAALVLGPQAYAFIVSLSQGNLPSWDDLMKQNATFQAKIDAEK
jgi:hypothetical protein